MTLLAFTPTRTLALLISITLHIGCIAVIAKAPNVKDLGQHESSSILVQLVQLDSGKVVAPFAALDAQQMAEPVAATEVMETENAGERRRPEQHYYAVADLSERPKVIKDLPPDFSLIVPKNGPKTLNLQLLISETGIVDEVAIEALSGEEQLPQEVQDEIKVAMGRMRFLPGKIRGQPVKSRLQIEIMLETSTAVVEAENANETLP